VEKREHCSLLVRRKISIAIMENPMEVSQEMKNGTTV
jgi:hypothetical protein